MTKIESLIPDALYAQVKQLAERENISVDRLVAIAWTAQDYLEARAARGNWQRARRSTSRARCP